MTNDAAIKTLEEPSDGWKERIIKPTLLGGIVGGGLGMISRHRKVHGLASTSATYATNAAIIAATYTGAREFVRVTRRADPDDLINSALGGFGSGALLGRLQGGQAGAIRYSVIFAVVGTTIDFATIKLRPHWKSFTESLSGDSKKSNDWLKLPDWSPIQVLDEEALAAKQERERKLYAQTTLGNPTKEES